MTTDIRLTRDEEAVETGRQEDQRKLLSGMGAVTGMHGQTLIHAMNSSLKRRSRRGEQSKTCGANVDDALLSIDESFDHICPERLTPTWSERPAIWIGTVSCEQRPAWWISRTASASLRCNAD